MQRSGGWKVGRGTFSRCKPEEQRQIRRLQLKKYLELKKKKKNLFLHDFMKFVRAFMSCCEMALWMFERTPSEKKHTPGS